MADSDLTTIQIHKQTKQRFRKLLVLDKKKKQDRKLVSEDFLIRMMNHYEETGIGNGS